MKTILTFVFLLVPVFSCFSEITGYWNFNGSLKATIGENLEWAWEQGDATFGTTETFEIPGIQGKSANVLKFPDSDEFSDFSGIEVWIGDGLDEDNWLFNEYSIIVDILYPETSSTDKRAIVSNAPVEQASIIINEEGKIGGTSFHGEILANSWYRVAIVVSHASKKIMYYLDGQKVGHESIGGLVDGEGKHSLADFFYLFTTNGLSKGGYISSLQFHNEALPDTVINDLGGTTKFSVDEGITGLASYSVETVGAVPGPWEFKDGLWVSEGSVAGCGGPYHDFLTSPDYIVSADGDMSLSFEHRHAFEADMWDAGQLWISVNGDDYADVGTDAFTANGYTGVAIIGNGIAKGQNGFGGTSAGYADGSYITTTANLGSFTAGDAISVRFVALYDDCATGTNPNWVIMSVSSDQMAIELDEPEDITLPGDEVVATSDNSPGGEQAPNAIDDNPSTKYLNFDKVDTGLTITTGGGVVTGLALTSANDAPDRDPANYILSGSNDDGATFTEIASGDVPEFVERFERQTLSFENDVAYTMYELIFPEVVNPGGANSMQIAEIELLAGAPEAGGDEPDDNESNQIEDMVLAPFGFKFGFTINTDEGKSYMVEATGDLLQWNKIETINGTGSSVQFTDTRNEVFQYQYYRVRVAE